MEVFDQHVNFVFDLNFYTTKFNENFLYNLTKSDEKNDHTFVNYMFKMQILQ